MGGNFTFISHATADNERFVIPFNEALRSRGINTYIDTSDFHPGDSLVSRMFDLGAARATSFVIVISRNSTRPYVRAELEYMVVRRIEDQVPIVPVILDDAAVPEPLRTLIQIRVTDEMSPADVADAVSRALVGHVPADAPKGSAWFAAPASEIRTDELPEEYLFRFFMLEFLSGVLDFHEISAVLPSWHKDGFSDPDIETGLYVLEQQGRIEQMFEMGSRLPIAIRLRGFAIDRFLTTHRPEMYEAATQDVVRAVLSGTCELGAIVKSTALPQSLVEHIGSELAQSGDASFEVYVGGEGYITAKPTLRRRLREDRQT